MNEVTTFRLYLMRAMYLLMVVGLGLSIWPDLLHMQSSGIRRHALSRACWRT